MVPESGRTKSARCSENGYVVAERDPDCRRRRFVAPLSLLSKSGNHKRTKWSAAALFKMGFPGCDMAAMAARTATISSSRMRIRPSRCADQPP